MLTPCRVSPSLTFGVFEPSLFALLGVLGCLDLAPLFLPPLLDGVLLLSIILFLILCMAPPPPRTDISRPVHVCFECSEFKEETSRHELASDRSAGLLVV